MNNPPSSLISRLKIFAAYLFPLATPAGFSILKPVIFMKNAANPGASTRRLLTAFLISLAPITIIAQYQTEEQGTTNSIVNSPAEPMATNEVEEAAPPTIVTNTIAFSPVIDLESFPVDALADQLKDIHKTENEALQKRTQEQFDAMAQRLVAIENSLQDQRGREFDILTQLHKFTLIVAIVFASIGVIGMAIIGIMLWRSNNRLAEVATGLSRFPRALGYAPIAGQLEGGPEFLDGPQGAPDETGQKLKGALAQLEHRIQELEHTSEHPYAIESKPSANGSSNGKGQAPKSGETETGMGAAKGNAVLLDTLLARGDSHMNKGEFHKALDSFREAESMAPENPEILVKIGTAFEKLRKMEQAIKSYDQAIEKDPSLTIAYLHKGRAFNRMSRFDEALECYEKALRTQAQ